MGNDEVADRGVGQVADMASWMTGRSSPAAVPMAVKPRMRSSGAMRTFMKPRVSSRVRVRRAAGMGIFGEAVGGSLLLGFGFGEADVG